MEIKDFSDLEDQIKHTLKNTFDAINFAGLRENIHDKTKNTSHEVKTNLKNKSQSFNEKIRNKKYNQHGADANITSKYKDNVHISKRPVGRISGILYMILGIIGGGVFGTQLIAYSIFTSLLSTFSIANLISLGLLFSFFVLSIALALRGMNLRKRVKRFRQYIKLLNNHTYCTIDQLAAALRKKDKFIVKDLRKMIDLGMFPQAHIDDNQTHFMLNDEIYQNYLDSQEALRHRKEAELKRQEEINEQLSNPEKKELRDAIELGKYYMEQIQNANDAINREEISTKLCRLQNILNQIFKHLKNNPKQLPEVNKLTNHYLPITLKLVSSYKDLNDQPIQGDNIKNAKNEIKKALDIINIAFEKLLDDLFGEVALDISTDISVLETLFAQEGLTKNDFKN